MDLHGHSYVPPGTLPKPGLLGRGIRLVLGIIILLSAFSVARSLGLIENARGIPESASLWVLVVVLFFSMSDMINLGLKVRWGQKAQLVTLGAALVCIAVDYIFYARLWAPPLGILFYLWFLLTAVPLGIALILAAILGTPGCEMRVYATIIAQLQGHSASEHYCHGGRDFIDRWEAHLGKR